MDTSPHPGIAEILARTAAPQRELEDHRVYRQLDSLGHVAVFMEHHVFAVLDFMWLLKSLQQRLTSVRVPWTPQSSGVIRRLINELVVAEESDEHDGSWTSHFELYLEAMDRAGASTIAVRGFVEDLDVRVDPIDAASRNGVPAGARSFIGETWRLVSAGEDHEIASAFAFGRENLIPRMFIQLVGLGVEFPEQLDLLANYLARHIELDAETHTPLAFRMVSELCSDDPLRWAGAQAAATHALRARHRLWDATSAAIGEQRLAQSSPAAVTAGALR